MSASAAPITRKQRLQRVFYFFPFQLLLAHFKRNQVLLIFWIFLFAVVTRNLGNGYGIPQLFLYPEYLGHVDFVSHFLLGIATGGFIMAFNIASYIINSHRFPFIATLAKPFYKYCINNFIIPIGFVVVFIINMVGFQLYSELEPITNVLIHLAGFLVGATLFITFCLTYFISTNKNLKKLFGIDPVEKDRERNRNRPRYSPVQGGLHRKERWKGHPSREWRVDTYLVHPFHINLARESHHYDRSMLNRVFTQNHINASIFEIGTIFTILFLGFFRETPIFMIPAAASLLLFFTMILMFASALHSWLKGWSTILFIGLIIAWNYTSQFSAFSFTNAAYGLNYDNGKAPYNYDVLNGFRDDSAAHRADFIQHLEVLNKWRLRNTPDAQERHEKPKLVLINTSGGGLRAATWTFYALQHADSLLDGQLMPHTHLITGSSGGMIGAAYMRELYLRSLYDSSLDLYNDSLSQSIAKDVLNPVCVTIAVNDLFLRFQRFSDGNYTYVKDRAYALEKQLNENTGGVLNKRLHDYTAPESDALIPTMILSPTIAGDGRRLLISSQPVSFLTANKPMNNVNSAPVVESVEFNRLFEGHDPMNLRFMSALRMSATFPYITPNVTLPTEPEMEVLDAGIRDNYGTTSAIKFLYTFRNWIATNTSGVVILQVRDQVKARSIEGDPSSKTYAENLLSPIGQLYRNLTRIQTYEQDQLLQYASLWFDGDIDIISLELQQDPESRISLSWRLTKNEKNRIRESLFCDENQESLQRLTELLH